MIGIKKEELPGNPAETEGAILVAQAIVALD
jgi:hypothetical protein